METFNRELQTGHTAAIFEGTPVIICDGLRCLLKLKIAGKTLITSQRVAGPYDTFFLPNIPAQKICTKHPKYLPKC